MGERDHVDLAPVVARTKDFADDVLEHVVLAAEDLIDRERADGEDEVRLEQLHLAHEPMLAVLDLFGVGTTVPSALRFSGEAPRDGCKVHASSDRRFALAGRALEPFEERLAGGPREGAAELAFARAGRLADEQDRARDGWAVD